MTIARRPNRLHHTAYVTRDLEATRAFYEDVIGLPYSFAGNTIMSEISGGTPYGASTIAGGDGSRMPSENELAGARFQGEHVARITLKLAA